MPHNSVVGGRKNHIKVISPVCLKTSITFTVSRQTSFFVELKCYYFFSLLFFTHLRILLCAVDFSESHLGKNYRIKKCRIRNFPPREESCFLSEQLFYWSTTGSSPKLHACVPEKSHSYMIIPICFAKGNSCLYSICFSSMH